MVDVDAFSLPQDRQPGLKVMALPADADHFGTIPGGWLMAWMDRAGLTEAQAFAQGKVALVAVSPFQMHQPVHPGDVVSLYVARLRVGKTSITVKVEAFVERAPNHVKVAMVTDATFTYVAIDQEGKAREISVS